MAKRRFLSIIIIILSLVLVIFSGYRDRARQEEAMAEVYLNKIWIADGWPAGDYREFYFCFDQMADGKCEGGFEEGFFRTMCGADCFRSIANPFSGTIDGNAAECRFTDRMGRTGNMAFVFVNENEIEAAISYDGEGTPERKTFRPHHIRDVDAFTLQDELTTQVELEYWGSVYFVAGIDRGVSDKPHPGAYLVNENGDILCDFRASFHVGSAVYDAGFRDVNGDGLTDVIISTHFVDWNGVVEEEMPCIGWLFRQSADGTFELSGTRYSGLKSVGFGLGKDSKSWFSVKEAGERETGTKVPRRYHPYTNSVVASVGFLARKDITTAHVEENPENSVPEELIQALSEALENNDIEEYAAEISAEYVPMQENEIMHYIREDTSGILENFYYDFPGGNREWFLFERDNDIIVRRKIENEEYPWCYYKFPCKGGEYGMALRAYGKNEDYFFISWEDDDYLLVTKREDGQVNGIAVYQMYGYALIGWILGLEKTPDGEAEVRFYTYSTSGSGVVTTSFLDY